MRSLCREGASALGFMAEVKCEPEVSIPYPTEASPNRASPPSAVHHQGPNSNKPLEKTRATHILVHMAQDSEPRHPHTHNLEHLHALLDTQPPNTTMCRFFCRFRVSDL